MNSIVDHSLSLCTVDYGHRLDGYVHRMAYRIGPLMHLSGRAVYALIGRGRFQGALGGVFGVNVVCRRW